MGVAGAGQGREWGWCLMGPEFRDILETDDGDVCTTV